MKRTRKLNVIKIKREKLKPPVATQLDFFMMRHETEAIIKTEIKRAIDNISIRVN